MRIFFLLTCLAAAGGWALSAAQVDSAKKQTAKSTHKPRRTSTVHSAHTTTTASAHKSTAGHKSSTAVAAAGTRSTSSRRRVSSSKSKPAPRQWAQSQPTQERYKEIQEALVSRGYFNGQADGTWGPDSVDALKRFQHDQNLTDDGKIGSLSLIALGLGPKRPAPDAAPTEKSENKERR